MSSNNRQPNSRGLSCYNCYGVHRNAILRRILPIVLSLTAAFAFAGNAFASIPDTNGLIHGCFTVPQGTIHALFLRDPAYTSHCPPGQAPLDWYALPAPGASGNVVQSNGTGGYVSAPLAASSIPAGSNNYIQNRTTPQTGANFNIDGNGIVGGTFSAGSHINTNATYKIADTTVLNVLASTNNVLVGNGAGTSLVPFAIDNVAVGTDALQLNTRGRGNTAIGYQALLNNTTGDNNTATGLQALASNIAGNNNTANGRLALLSNTSGMNNTASGEEALYSNSTGANNTAIGHLALDGNTTGFSNMASGDSALAANVSGNNNTANGSNALAANTSGSINTATGSHALASNLSGENTADGGDSLFANTTGPFNTAVGWEALLENTTGGQNVGIGVGAGSTNITGTGDTFLGTSTGVAVDGLSNATAIGANAQVGASNALVLGGTGGNAVSVGIGTTAPHSTLQVVGNYVQVPSVATAPPAADCASAADYGREVEVNTTPNKLYFCGSAGWNTAP